MCLHPRWGKLVFFFCFSSSFYFQFVRYFVYLFVIYSFLFIYSFLYFIRFCPSFFVISTFADAAHAAARLPSSI